MEIDNFPKQMTENNGRLVEFTGQAATGWQFSIKRDVALQM